MQACEVQRGIPYPVDLKKEKVLYARSILVECGMKKGLAARTTIDGLGWKGFQSRNAAYDYIRRAI